MNLLQMSLSGGMLVLAAALLRCALLHRLPKYVFPALWGVALLRLLLPVSVPSRLSIYRLLGYTTSASAAPAPVRAPTLPLEMPAWVPPLDAGAAAMAPATALWPVAVWAAGCALLALYFAVAAAMGWQRVRFALPLHSPAVHEWRGAYPMARPLRVLRSEHLSVPVATGILRPRIILPASMDDEHGPLLRDVLTHEYFHLRHFDAVWKLLLTAALCVHWFNPLVWLLYALAGRDLELRCDAMVLRDAGQDARRAYAGSIIGMAERCSGPLSRAFFSAFSHGATAERITAIMKYKRPSRLVTLLALPLILAVTTVLAFSAPLPARPESPSTRTHAAEPATRQASGAPIEVGAGLEFDGGAYQWPGNVLTLRNTGDKVIVGYEIACAAYDKDGKPLALYWDAMNVAADGSVGAVGFGEGGVDYGIVTDISPNSPRAYTYLYTAAPPQWAVDERLAGIEQDRKDVERQIREMERELRGSLAGERLQERLEWLRDWERGRYEWLEERRRDAGDFSYRLEVNQVDSLYYSLFDGWDQQAGTHCAAYILPCVKTLTYEDGAVWANPAYTAWASEHAGRAMDVEALRERSR